MLDLDHVAKMVEKVETRIGDSLGKIEKKADEAFKDHNTRIIELERWQWKLMGVWAVLSFVVVACCTVTAYVVIDEIREVRQQIWRATPKQ